MVVKPLQKREEIPLVYAMSFPGEQRYDYMSKTTCIDGAATPPHTHNLFLKTYWIQFRLDTGLS
jgi:hypothetical protein